MTIKDRDGNEHRARIGDLVIAEEIAPYVGRIVEVCGSGVVINCVARGYAVYSTALMTTWLSDVPSDVSKGDPIFIRRQRLLDNLNSLGYMSSPLVQDASRRLIHRLQCAHSLGEHSWFWQGVAESADDPRKISYAPSVELIDNDSRRRKCSISKFLSGPAREHGLTLSEEEIRSISNIVGQIFPASNSYTFEIVNGLDIQTAYRYETQGDNTWGSCMSYHTFGDGNPYLLWYSKNRNTVSLVKVLLGGKYCGRALLWNTEQGVKVLDRVYPSDNGPHTAALHKLAEQEGWDYKARQGCFDGYLNSGRMDYTVRMHRSEEGLYPYCDTFKYTYQDPGEHDTIEVGMSGGDYCFNQTDGTYEGEEDEHGLMCHECGDEMLEENARYSLRSEEYYCRRCYNNLFIQLNYRLPSGACTISEEWRGDCHECDHCGRYRLSEHTRDVADESWCEICINNAAFLCECCEQLYPNDDRSDVEDNSVCVDCREEWLQEWLQERERDKEQRAMPEAGAVTNEPQLPLDWYQVEAGPSPGDQSADIQRTLLQNARQSILDYWTGRAIAASQRIQEEVAA